MATNSHQFHNNSHQKTLHSVCQGIQSLTYQPLSKSSSNLAAIGQTGAEVRQELRKSFSSSACRAQVRESEERSPPSSEGSLIHSEFASTGSTMSSLSPLDDGVQSSAKSTNHFLSVDWSLASGEGLVAGTHAKSSTAENMGAAVQRSLSDLTCSCKQQSSISQMETSAMYSAMVSSHSSYGAAMGNVGYGSDTYEKVPGFQSHMISVPLLPRNQNVPKNVFDNSAVSHSATVFTDSREHHITTLGPPMPGNNLTTKTMYAQDGTTSSNFSTGIYQPGIRAIPNNHTALPGNIRQGLAMGATTVPAYCHSLPIPSFQLAPRLVCSVSESEKEQINSGNGPSFPATEKVTFPAFASAVGESGLGAKCILTSCRMHDHLLHSPSAVQQGRAQPEMKTTYVVLNSHQGSTNAVTMTKDNWTMTSMNDITWGFQPLLGCKDAEVQTIPAKDWKFIATTPLVVAESHPHVFPEVSWGPEALGETTPVQEVRWDDEGMTWEVYGAAVDPEVLGLAIQKHLKIQIEQFETEPETPSGKSAEEQSVKEEKKTSFRTVMHCLRNPTCCARSSTAVE